MFDILIVLGVFVAVVGVHLAICRASGKRCLYVREFLMLATIGLALCLGILCGGLFPAISAAERLIVTSLLLYVLLIPTYLCFYVLTILMSPSKKVLMLLAAHGSLDRTALHQGLAAEAFIQTRVEDLLVSGMVENKKGRLVLTPQGRMYLNGVKLFGVLMGRPQGG